VGEYFPLLSSGYDEETERFLTLPDSGSWWSRYRCSEKGWRIFPSKSCRSLRHQWQYRIK